jgi:hypothetical protein
MVVSVTEVVIPILQQLLRVRIHEAVDIAEFCSSKSTAAAQPYRVEPKLRDTIVPFHMDVRRLTTIARVEEEPIWPNCEDGWHRFA